VLGPDDPPVLAPWCVRADETPRPSVPPWMVPSTVGDDAPAGLAEPGDDAAVADEPAPVVPLAEHLALRAEHAAIAAERAALAAEHAALAAEHAALAAEHAELTREMETLRGRVLAASEPELVRLACAVAARVVSREVRVDPALLAAWAREAVAALEGREGAAVVVAPDVAARVPAEAWAQSLGSDHAITVDPSLPPGAVAVRAGASTIDVSAPGRLAAVAADLFADVT